MRYELSEGELIVTPSTSYFHNEIRRHFNTRLRAFVESHGLGEVTSATDVKLVGETVRRPGKRRDPLGSGPMDSSGRLTAQKGCASRRPATRGAVTSGIMNMDYIVCDRDVFEGELNRAVVNESQGRHNQLQELAAP
jgi:hypothetical protein